jgi:hypothetical protein
MATIWFVLAVLFFASGLFVRGMLSTANREDRPVSDFDEQDEFTGAAIGDVRAATD